MKKTLTLLLTLVLAGFIAGCGKPGGPGGAQTPDPATQPEAQAALFQRTYDRAKSLIENKEFKAAQATLDLFKQYKLSPEQQKAVDQLQTQIPK